MHSVGSLVLVLVLFVLFILLVLVLVPLLVLVLVPLLVLVIVLALVPVLVLDRYRDRVVVLVPVLILILILILALPGLKFSLLPSASIYLWYSNPIHLICFCRNLSIKSNRRIICMVSPKYSSHSFLRLPKIFL